MAEKISAVSGPALASILIPCCGMIEYTKLCVPSVLRFSRQPFELIFVDVGSLDGTAEYLAGIKAAAGVRVEVVRTPADLGIPDACKEALREARGEYLVLLNNDTVVTDGWLQQLINLVSLSPALGLAGPMSNCAPPPQRVESVPYRIKPRRAKPASRFGPGETLLEMDAMHAFARELREKNKGKWAEADQLGGFCLLLKREVLHRVGTPNLEKASELGLFDAENLTMKARQAGFTLGVCRDQYIHHFGTRTFSHGAPPEGALDTARNGSRAPA